MYIFLTIIAIVGIVLLLAILGVMSKIFGHVFGCLMDLVSEGCGCVFAIALFVLVLMAILL